MSSIIKFSASELRRLASSGMACVEERRMTQSLALQPWCLANLKESIKNLLDYKIGKFDKEYNGILLSYKNLKILQNIGAIRNDHSDIHFQVQADYFIFRPYEGATLRGIVNKKSVTHLGIIVHRVFNVVIPRPTEEPGNRWIGTRVQEGQEVAFKIVMLDLFGALPYIRGELDESPIPEQALVTDVYTISVTNTTRDSIVTDVQPGQPGCHGITKYITDGCRYAGHGRPSAPRPSLNLSMSMSAEKRKLLELGQGMGSSSEEAMAFVPFPPRPPEHGAAQRQRILRTCPIRDVIPDQPARERFRIYPSMQSSGKLQFSASEIYDFTADDLQDLGEIGRGAFGAVNKMVHRKTSRVMAVKRIRSTVDEKEQKELLMDLEVVMKSNECPYIVQFYGALFKEGDCWICMELMDTSLDKFYKFTCERMQTRIPENIIAKITLATVKALNYLKEKLKIIHRDVKPSNILLDRRGNIKLCDFGISGKLVDSIARTRDAGCRPYMAPERIDPQRARGYDVRSDVWSLGITLMEVATGAFPYPRWGSVFEQLSQVVQGDPPRLTNNGNTFSQNFVNFVNTCLIKEETQRPKYNKLLEHPFVRGIDQSRSDVALYVCDVLDAMERNGVSPFTTDQPAQAWTG